MAESYGFKFAGSSKDLVSRIEREARSNGVSYSGNEKAGVVEGMGLKATYEIDGKVIRITVHKIPFIVSWGKVRSVISQRAQSWGAEPVKADQIHPESIVWP